MVSADPDIIAAYNEFLSLRDCVDKTSAENIARKDRNNAKLNAFSDVNSREFLNVMFVQDTSIEAITRKAKCLANRVIIQKAETLNQSDVDEIEDVEKVAATKLAAEKEAEQAKDTAKRQQEEAENIVAKNRSITLYHKRDLELATVELERAKLAQNSSTNARSRNNSNISLQNESVTKKWQYTVDKLTILLSLPVWIHRLKKGKQQQYLVSADECDQSPFLVADGDIVR